MIFFFCDTTRLYLASRISKKKEKKMINFPLEFFFDFQLTLIQESLKLEHANVL